jgi:hypothetical protein
MDKERRLTAWAYVARRSILPRDLRQLKEVSVWNPDRK